MSRKINDCKTDASVWFFFKDKAKLISMRIGVKCG